MKPILEIQNISKKFRINHRLGGYMSLRERMQNSLKFQRQEFEDFWALTDISFDVQAGESIGIIGRNGAGKSTLLKVLSKITPPTSGKIIARGRIASLLEVGTGFHPELTGRENIFFNGSLLGMKRKEIETKFDEIIDFSGVEKFLDTPLKHYSSGMQLRLAFAVAAFLEPEILIIDEVLAVGDAEFQRKCLGKMEDINKQGRTVLFVSHNLNAVNSFCSRAILIKMGKVEMQGETSNVIDHYFQGLSNNSGLNETSVERRGNGAIRIIGINLIDHNHSPIDIAYTGQDTFFSVEYSSNIKPENLIARLQVVSFDGYILFTCNNFHSSQPFQDAEKNGYLICSIPSLPLIEGQYRVNLQLLNNFEVADEIEGAFEFHVASGDYFGTGRLPKVKQGILVNHVWKVLPK